MIFALPLYDDNPIRETPVVTYGLIGMCIGAFLWELAHDPNVVTFQYGLIPAVLLGHAELPSGLVVIPSWATIFTSMFLHGGWLHLGGNMLFLWIFGNNVEDLLGRLRYVLLYFACGIAAALIQAGADPASQIPMVGASGAIAGVLGAYLIVYPRANVHVFVWIIIFFWIVTVPASVLLGVWFVMQLFSGLSSGARDVGVAFWAHVGGFATGVFLMMLLRPRRVILLHAPKTPVFASAPPSALSGRRTFHQGSVPSAGRRYPGPPSPWN